MFLGLCLLTAAPALAEKVMLDNSNPPFMFDGGGKKENGLYPAVLAEAFKRMGVPLEMETVPWKRAISAIDAGEAGVGGIYKNEERLKKYDYSEKLFDEVIMVYAPKGKEFEFKDVSSLNGKTVGVLQGWSYGDDFDAAVKAGKITAETAENDALNFKKLAAGRLDAILAIRESGTANLGAPEIASAVVALPAPLSSSPSFLAFNKSAAKADVLAKFNTALDQMKKDQTMDKLIKETLK